MAKGIGLIGNFRGKVGNMVGYNLKDSNNKQTQGVRVYQPIVKNPKTYGQAEQRAKLAPINATYRALKMIIDRGQEGKAYGNKSRLAWLSAAMKAFNGGWFEKGATITAPALVPLTKGTLSSLPFDKTNTAGAVISLGAAASAEITTVGAVAAILLQQYPGLKVGDQITGVSFDKTDEGFTVNVESIVIDPESTITLKDPIMIGDSVLVLAKCSSVSIANACIVSREGDNGAHLRSTENLYATDEYDADYLNDAAKEAAIKSYMAAGSNVDWAEESLQG